MQAEHKKAIQNCFSSLVERTDLEPMVTALYEKGVFSEIMIETYKNNSETERERKRRLYRDITRRGPRAFERLLDVLREMGHWDLVRELDPSSPLQLSARGSAANSSQRSNDSDDEFLSLRKQKQKHLAQQKTIPTPPKELVPQETNNNDSTDVSKNLLRVPVKKSTKFMEDDDTKAIKLYRTRGRQRGVLVVFSYIEFAMGIESIREGAQVDCDHLQHLFSELGFEQTYHYNLTLEETRNALKELKKVPSGVESVFIVFSSHGYERKGTHDTDIRCSDGKLISFTDIAEYFNNSNLPNLINIPKVFILQVCRGSSSEYIHAKAQEIRMPQTVSTDGTLSCLPSLKDDNNTASTNTKSVEMALFTDILIAHSTLPGLVSRRDSEKGSWFIQTICEVFAEHAHHCHVDKMFTLVDRRMRERFHIQTSSVDRWGFNNKLYLHPGLFE